MDNLYFEFRQNNSGGSFEVDLEKGISHYVIIEAKNYIEANQKAFDIGLYFDGCESGNDCPCCGDRWYASDESDGSAIPSLYGESVYELKPSYFNEYISIHRINKPIEIIERPCK